MAKKKLQADETTMPESDAPVEPTEVVEAADPFAPAVEAEQLVSTVPALPSHEGPSDEDIIACMTLAGCGPNVSEFKRIGVEARARELFAMLKAFHAITRI